MVWYEWIGYGVLVLLFLFHFYVAICMHDLRDNHWGWKLFEWLGF